MEGITTSKLAQPFDSVNSPPLDSQLPLIPDMMIHHSKALHKYIYGNKERVWRETAYYGVSSSYRILPKELFFKRFDQIRQFLQNVLGLPTAEREFTLRASRFGAYYGNCYAKIATLCKDPGCSKATAFRVLRKLQDQGLVTVIPRYLQPYRRQISSLILFHRLFLLIARYLAEHGQRFHQEWLKPVLAMSGRDFWSFSWLEVAPGLGGAADGSP